MQTGIGSSRRPTKNPWTTRGGPPREGNQIRAGRTSTTDNHNNSSTPPPRATRQGPTTPTTGAGAASSRRRRISLSLSPGAFRAVVESAGGAFSRAGRERHSTGEDLSGAAGENGSDSCASIASDKLLSSPRESADRAVGAAEATPTAAAAACITAAASSQHQSQPSRGRSNMAHRSRSMIISTSLSPNTLRPKSTKFNPVRVREGSAGVMGQQPTNDATGHVDPEPRPQGESYSTDKTAAEATFSPQSSPQPSLRHPRRRRTSVSLSPRYLRKVVGFISNQDTSDGGGGGKSTNVSDGVLLPLGAHPRPLSNVTPNLRRGSTSLSPTAIRAAMRSSIVKEQGGIRSGNSSFNDKLHESGKQSVLSSKTTATDNCFLAPNPQLQQRRKRFTRRSATSFSLGAGAAAALRSAIAMGAPGGGDKAVREIDPTTAKAMPLSAGIAASEAVDYGFPDASSVAAPATGDGASLPCGDSNHSSSRRRRHGRSMSLVLGRGASLLAGASPSPSPPLKRRGGSRNNANSSRSPLSGGSSGGGGGVSFRRRLRRAVGIGAGGILDTVPVWKQPEIMKGLQER